MCASSRPPTEGDVPPSDERPSPPAWDAEADEWLVAQAVAGSRFSGQAFETLLRRHQHRIYRIALRMTGNAADADDVAQDVAVQLWRMLVTFSGSSTFTTWLYRIVVNRCLKLRRARRVVGRVTEPLLDADHPTVAGPEARVLGLARVDATAAALDALPADQRTALVLCQIEGLSYREAAAVVGVTEAALRSRLERGRRGVLAAMREWA